MTQWIAAELDAVGAAEELQIAPRRSDGSPAPFTTIWVVRVGDDLYVRSWRGREGGWFRQALRHHEGRIRAGGVERDVTFEDVTDTDQPAIDAAYRTKYARYAGTYVEPMVSPAAAAAALRLVAS